MCLAAGKMRPAPGPVRGYTSPMNKPHILLPLAVAGLVLSTALTTAALVNAADDPSPKANALFDVAPLSVPLRAKLVRADAALQQAEVAALFEVAPLTVAMRSKLTGADAVTPQAEAEALFEVAPMSGPMRARLAKEDADAALQQAEVDAMFAVGPMSAPRQTQTGPAKDPQSARGREIYLGLCFACHLPDGTGLAGVFPPLAGSDFLLADRDRAIRIVLKGLIGPVTVNGVTFNSAMPPLETTLAEQQIADVLTYVTGEWGNRGTPCSVEEVHRVKQEMREFAGLLTVAP